MATEEWSRAYDKNTGRYYYWNTSTRESRWDIPDHLKPPADKTRGRRSNAEKDAPAAAAEEEVKEEVDPNDTPEKLEERRSKAAKEKNRVGVEHYLATLGWAGARIITDTLLSKSIEPYAKAYKFKEEETLTAFWTACQEKLDGEKKDLDRLVLEAERKVKEAEAAALKTKMELDSNDNRRQLFDFLTKQTAVLREEEKAAQIAAYKARAEKRMRDREKREMLGSTYDNQRSRPRREIKQRYVEKDGFMVLREDTPEAQAKGRPQAPPQRKPPPSAYALFSKATMQEFKDQGIKMDFPTMQRTIAAKWKVLDEEGRVPFVEAAKVEREKFYAEQQQYLNGEGMEVEPDNGTAPDASPAPAAPGPESPMPTEPSPALTPAEYTPAPSEATPAGDAAAPKDEATASDGIRNATETPLAQTPSAPTGEENDETSISRSPTQTPFTKDGSDDDDDSSSDSEDEDDGGRRSGNDGPSNNAIWSASISKFPRPALEEIIDCALLAIGPRSFCAAENLYDWAVTSSLGQALSSRVKLGYTREQFLKNLRRHVGKGRFETYRQTYAMSKQRLEEIAKTDSLAKVKRMRKEQDGGNVNGESSRANKDAMAQLRKLHNEEIKRGVIESAFLRWSYMVRKYAALEPFLSETAKGKVLKFKELLELNGFLDIIKPELDDNPKEWSEVLYRVRKELDFRTTNPNPPYSKEELPQPKGIENGELRAYQRRGIAWLMKMYENGCNAVLADEMGLGKTLQTISFLTALKENSVQGPFLVIVPLSVLTNWANEFRKWSPSMRVIKLHSSSREERDRRKKEVLNNFRDFDVIVTTYEMIVSTNMRNVLTSKLWWRCVVIDEGHKIKNDETSLAQAVRSMHCQYRLLLTGTPLQNNLHELWAMLNFLDSVVFDSSEKFDAGFDLTRDIVDRELLSKAHYLLRPFCLRRTKLEVESKLPPKEEIVVQVPMSEMQMFWYKRLILMDAELLERVEDSLRNGDQEESASNANDWKRLQSLMMQLRKCCNHPYLFPGAEPTFDGTTNEDIVKASGKLVVLDRLLKKLHEKGHRVVIFSQFTSMLDILSDFLNLRGWNHARLDGTVNRVQRAVDVLQYNQTNSAQFAYLMSTRAGGLGINLATADTVILYDSDWNPQVDLQAMDRVHRIGQEKPVHVYRVVTKGTIEERIVQRAKKKLFLDSMVNRGSTAQSEALEGLSKAEMLKMLKFGASAVFGDDGETVKPITDAEISAMIDRSDEAREARAKAAEKGTSSLVKGDNALDFDLEKAEGEGEAPKTLREIYGKDFIEQVHQQNKTAATPAERSSKRARKSRGQSPTPGDDAAEAITMQDIASEWKASHHTPGAAAAAAAASGSATKSGRKIKSRFTQVDGHTVLKANAYSLEEGEQSVFARELKNRKRGPDQATIDELNRSLGRGRQVAGRDYTNEQHCLACWDGGELILCDQCPVAVHEECLAPGQAPNNRGRGGNPTWRCPHHSCLECDRKSAAAGGLLFRCTECPRAYCEDHLPMEGIRLHDQGRCTRFEELGFRKPAQGYYILCSPNCQEFYNDRTTKGIDEAIKRAVQRGKTGG